MDRNREIFGAKNSDFFGKAKGSTIKGINSNTISHIGNKDLFGDVRKTKTSGLGTNRVFKSMGY